MRSNLKFKKLDLGMGSLLFISYIFQLVMYEFNFRYLFPLKMLTVDIAIYWYLLRKRNYKEEWKRRHLISLEWTAYTIAVGMFYGYIVYKTRAIWLFGL